MSVRIAILLSALSVVLLVAGCNMSFAPSGDGTPVAAAVTPAGGGPRANVTRPADFTPGAQRPGGPGGQAQRTPVAQASPAARGPAPTPVIAANQTPASNIVPTAVPNPVVALPTIRAAGSGTQATPSADFSYTPVPMPSMPPLPTLPPAVTRESLRGKIIFFSDRSGYATLFVMEPDGSNQRPCNCSYLLESLVSDELLSPDRNNLLFYRTVGGSARGSGDQQIWARNLTSGFESPVTGNAPGFPGLDYDPAWSPDARYIAWVSQTNGFDEIYLFDSNSGSNVRLTESHAEWYKRPSFSPDGSQIAFWTNKETAERKQVWVMNLDGSDAHNLSQNAYNDYDPLWVK